jgi:hypothetical protein
VPGFDRLFACTPASLRSRGAVRTVRDRPIIVTTTRVVDRLVPLLSLTEETSGNRPAMIRRCVEPNAAEMNSVQETLSSTSRHLSWAILCAWRGIISVSFHEGIRDNSSFSDSMFEALSVRLDWRPVHEGGNLASSSRWELFRALTANRSCS